MRKNINCNVTIVMSSDELRGIALGLLTQIVHGICKDLLGIQK